MKTKRPALDLPLLVAELKAAALDLSGTAPDLVLTGARLADGFRDAGIAPPLAGEWAMATQGLDQEALNRLELLVRMLRHPELGRQVSACLASRPAAALDCFPKFACGPVKLLGLDLLLKSPFRIEELARKWAFALGASIAGEAEAESTARRERLDFGSVLKNVEEADKSRAQRMKKLAEIEEARRKAAQEAYERAGRE